MITAVTTCMGRREHLEMSLPLMLDEFDRVIVVDWSCPQSSGKWAEKEGAEVVYKYDRRHFNISKARNLGARAVKTRSVCFVDADVLVMPGIKTEIQSLLDLSTMVLATSPQSAHNHSLNGFIALDIGQFWGVGGYDETLTGYALEDLHLRARLLLDRKMGPKRLSVGALGAIRHPNELRGRYYEEPISVSARRNYNLLVQWARERHGIIDWQTDPRVSEIRPPL